MGTHNICLYKEVDKTYTGCNLKTTELLVCVLKGHCVAISSNTVYQVLLSGFRSRVRISVPVYAETNHLRPHTSISPHTELGHHEQLYCTIHALRYINASAAKVDYCCFSFAEV